MAKPAFIYAFDNLGPYRFIELCGEVLGSRYKGFLLGGEGSDGGIDGEIDKILGVWKPEVSASILNEIVQPEHDVVFQFKHKVTARVGQRSSRTQLLNLYKCGTKKVCEIHSELIISKQPTTYVLVTNVEVNSQFRSSFIEQCMSENKNIAHYQVIGLDELVSWLTMMPELRQLYFPTIFGAPRFDLRIQLNPALGINLPVGNIPGNLLGVNILNVGIASSFIERMEFQFIIDGEIQTFSLIDLRTDFLSNINPRFGTAIEPGRKQTFYYPFSVFGEIKEKGHNIFPNEIHIYDEVGNMYSKIISENIRSFMLPYLSSEER